MSLGHEPTYPFCRVFAVAITLWPAYCWGEAARKDSSNSWTATEATSPSDAPAEPQNAPGSLQDSTKELPNPWESSRPSAVDSAQAPRGEAVDPGDEDWLEEAELVLNDGAAQPLDSKDSLDASDANPQARTRPKVPNYSLWLGTGLGWAMPFGDLWGTCMGFDAYGSCTTVSNVASRHYFGSGLGLEFDAGMRVARNYNLYALWERSWFAPGDAANGSRAHQNQGDSDFIALGLRVSTDPEKVGFLLDIAVGTRRMRARWEDGTQLQLTQAPFETRIGIGADVRLDDNWSFAPLLSLGLGSFGKMQWVYPDGTIMSASQPNDVALTHGWLGIQMSVHADVFGTQ